MLKIISHLEMQISTTRGKQGKMGVNNRGTEGKGAKTGILILQVGG